jgi:uroporphyrin-III C-methyltransferase
METIYSKANDNYLQKETSSNGKVIIAGAGPGDPELLAMKLVRYLKKADVVLVDRLVSTNIIEEYASPDAEIISVGKQCRRGLSVPQSTINELMVRFANEGKLVVRLKGGDVSIFSNVLDELEVLVNHRIVYEIIPGITAALGAAAYTGIPLTARNHASAVRFLTYYKSDVLTEDYWKELANTSDTLVFYMSGETLPAIVEKLTAHRISSDKLLAIIQQATTPNQHVEIINLYNTKDLKDKHLASPTLLIIGKVVALYQQFKWLLNYQGKEEYFQPINDNLNEYNSRELNQKLLIA